MSRSPRTATLLSGILGGLVVLVVGAVLIATDVIETGDTTQVVEQAPITRPAAARSSGLTVNEVYKRVGAGVVFIRAQVSQRSESPLGLPQEEGTATGSGFVLDDEGHILTNEHVVEGARDVQVRFEQDKIVSAKVVGEDASTDLALLKVDPEKVDLRPLALGSSKDVNVGDPAIAIGNPFGFDRTVTTGIISALQRQIDAPNGFSIDNVLQTDASINPGNSGGPLLDATGKVIGINSQIATGGSNGSVGIGFAVPVDTAKVVVPQLKREGKVRRAYLGVSTSAITEEIAKEEDFPVDEGALVAEVTADSPADEAGLRGGARQTPEGLIVGGDLIVEVDGQKISKPEDVATAIADRKPGETITLKYYRGDDERTTRLKLGERPASAARPSTAPGPGGPDDDQGGGGQGGGGQGGSDDFFGLP